MRFSIIVPIYNVAEYLEQCLSSIAVQTCRDFEAILIDDGSTDGSSEICDKFTEQCDNFISIHQKNKGVSNARNRGLDTARGDWIIFVDADDWIEADMLECLSRYLKTRKADLYCFNIGLLCEDLSGGGRAFSSENSLVSFKSEKEKFRYCRDSFMQYKIGWEVYTFLFKKKIIDDNRIRFVDMDKVYAEDYLFTFTYLLKTYEICCLCHFFYHYRLRDASLFHSRDSASALRRLNGWIDEAYKSVCEFGLQYYRKHFEELYFTLIQQQTQSALNDLSREQIRQILFDEENKEQQKRWIRKLERRKLFYLLKTRKRSWL